jgi:hypothetical protein
LAVETAFGVEINSPALAYGLVLRLHKGEHRVSGFIPGFFEATSQRLVVIPRNPLLAGAGHQFPATDEYSRRHIPVTTHLRPVGNTWREMLLRVAKHRVLRTPVFRRHPQSRFIHNEGVPQDRFFEEPAGRKQFTDTPLRFCKRLTPVTRQSLSSVRTRAL